MKIRLMGSPDLVRQWAIELEREYGVKGREYDNKRTGDGQVRFYLDLDDRVAEQIIEGMTRARREKPDPEPMRSANPRRKKAAPPSLPDLRKRLERLKQGNP